MLVVFFMISAVIIFVFKALALSSRVLIRSIGCQSPISPRPQVPLPLRAATKLSLPPPCPRKELHLTRAGRRQPLQENVFQQLLATGSLSLPSMFCDSLPHSSPHTNAEEVTEVSHTRASSIRATYYHLDHFHKQLVLLKERKDELEVFKRTKTLPVATSG